jgi:sigma-B regulation protein RsbU (phosphoserine phosphatase)
VRSLATVPLVVEDRSIGVLTVYSLSERAFASEDLRFLQLIANQAAIALEGVRLYREELARQRLDRELAVGREIQLSMLPDTCPVMPGWEVAAAYQAALEVGGDFYDLFHLSGRPDHWGIVIADVAGKGVPAALYMVLSRTTIRNTALPDNPPAAVLRRTNQLIRTDSQADLFLSAFYAVLDIQSGLLTYANAGHNPPLVWSAARRDFTELTTAGIVLGIIDNADIGEQSICLEPGDTVVLYTDGVTEATDRELDEFGVERLQAVIREALLEDPPAAVESLTGRILLAVADFSGNSVQHDDQTLCILRRRAQT